MGKKSGGGTQTVVEKNDPPAIVAPHLDRLYSAAGHWFNQGPQGQFPGEVAAHVPWNMRQGLAMTRDATYRNAPYRQAATDNLQSILKNEWLNGNPFASGAMERANPTAAGAFLNGNPHIDRMVDAATRDVREEFMESIAPSLASQFSAAGRTGSGAHVGAFGAATGKLAGRLGDISANIRGTAYENERNRMAQAFEAERARRFNAYESEQGRKVQASAMMPSMLQMGYLDADKMMQAGALERDMEQERIDREMERWYKGKDEPLNRMMAYSSILQGATPYMSSSQTQSSAQKYNRLSGAIGGGLGGYALGSVLGGFGPMGAALGALGGLFG